VFELRGVVACDEGTCPQIVPDVNEDKLHKGLELSASVFFIISGVHRDIKVIIFSPLKPS
jgi:hypothetical protein